MHDTTAPVALTDLLERLGASEMLMGYVKRQHIYRRVSWYSFERFVDKQGYRITLEDNNLYGRVRLERISTTPTPKMRLITRSDHAATFGSKRRAA